MDQYNFKILVLFYSFTGKTAKLADFIAEGAKEISGAEVEIKQVPELIPQDFFESKPELKKARESLFEETSRGYRICRSSFACFDVDGFTQSFILLQVLLAGRKIQFNW